MLPLMGQIRVSAVQARPRDGVEQDVLTFLLILQSDLGFKMVLTLRLKKQSLLLAMIVLSETAALMHAQYEHLRISSSHATSAVGLNERRSWAKCICSRQKVIRHSVLALIGTNTFLIKYSVIGTRVMITLMRLFVSMNHSLQLK